MTKKENLKILNAFVYPHEAHLAKMYLYAEGIDSELRDEFTARVYNFYSNAIGGVNTCYDCGKEWKFRGRKA
jgi:hypothetical protein